MSRSAPAARTPPATPAAVVIAERMKPPGAGGAVGGSCEGRPDQGDWLLWGGGVLRAGSVVLRPPNNPPRKLPEPDGRRCCSSSSVRTCSSASRRRLFAVSSACSWISVVCTSMYRASELAPTEWLMRSLGLSVLSGRAEPAHAFEQARDQFPFLGCHGVLLQTTSLLQSLSRRGSTAMISFCRRSKASLTRLRRLGFGTSRCNDEATRSRPWPEFRGNDRLPPVINSESTYS